MSKPSLKRFRGAKPHLKDKDGLFEFLRDEIGNLVGEIDDGFKGITFEDNFAGKIIEVTLEGGSQLTIANPLGKTPSGFIVLSGAVPWIVQGPTWDKDQISFNSTCFREITPGSSVVFNTGNEEIQISEPYLPQFVVGMQIIFRNTASGTIPAGLAFNTPYWIKALGGGFPSNFTLSAEKGGATINLTSGGSGTFRIAAYGTVKILLLK